MAASNESVGMLDDSAGPAKLYGAVLEQRLLEEAMEADRLRHRRRMNCAPIFISLLLPWLMFVLTYSVTSFYLHYACPITTAALLVAFVALCILAASAAKKTWTNGHHDWFYKAYIAAAMTVAVVAGACIGDYSFWHYMHPLYEIQHMATYTNVDPSSERLWTGEIQPTQGKRFQDAGQVYFQHGSFLDQNKSMSLKMGALYCVAPIVNPHCQKNCGYDFWAVGIDCCSEDSAHFRCGDFANPHSHSGLRLMDEGRRPFFRLAVLEAEGAHRIVSPHPIFFHWTQDPVNELSSWDHEAHKYLVISMFASFGVSAAALSASIAGCARRAIKDARV